MIRRAFVHICPLEISGPCLMMPTNTAGTSQYEQSISKPPPISEDHFHRRDRRAVRWFAPLDCARRRIGPEARLRARRTRQPEHQPDRTRAPENEILAARRDHHRHAREGRTMEGAL